MYVHGMYLDPWLENPLRFSSISMPSTHSLDPSFLVVVVHEPYLEQLEECFNLCSSIRYLSVVEFHPLLCPAVGSARAAGIRVLELLNNVSYGGVQVPQ